MMWGSVVLMVVAAFLGAVGQVFLKRASDGFSFAHVLMNGWLWGFAFSYGVAVLINIWVYRQGGEVSVVYPLIALSYVFSAVIAWRFLGEDVSVLSFVGALVIVLGVVLTTVGGRL